MDDSLTTVPQCNDPFLQLFHINKIIVFDRILDCRQLLQRCIVLALAQISGQRFVSARWDVAQVHIEKKHGHGQQLLRLLLLRAGGKVVQQDIGFKTAPFGQMRPRLWQPLVWIGTAADLRRREAAVRPTC